MLHVDYDRASYMFAACDVLTKVHLHLQECFMANILETKTDIGVIFGLLGLSVFNSRPIQSQWSKTEKGRGERKKKKRQTINLPEPRYIKLKLITYEKNIITTEIPKLRQLGQTSQSQRMTIDLNVSEQRPVTITDW